MCQHREESSTAHKTAREALQRRLSGSDRRPTGHLGSRPRGNQEVNQGDLNRSMERLAAVLGS